MFRSNGKSSTSANQVKPTVDSTTSSKRRFTNWKPALRKLKNGIFLREDNSNKAIPLPQIVSRTNEGAWNDPSIITLFDRSSYRALDDQKAAAPRPRVARRSPLAVEESEIQLLPLQPQTLDIPGETPIATASGANPPPAVLSIDAIRSKRATIHGDSSLRSPLQRNPSPVKVVRARPSSSYSPAVPENDEFSMALRKKLHRTSQIQEGAVNTSAPAHYVPTHAASDFMSSIPERRRSRLHRKPKQPEQFISAVDEDSEDFQNFIRRSHLEHLMPTQNLRRPRMSMPSVRHNSEKGSRKSKDAQNLQNFLRNSHYHYEVAEQNIWRQSIISSLPGLEEDEATEFDESIKTPPQKRYSMLDNGLSNNKRLSVAQQKKSRPTSMAGSILGKMGGYIKPTMPMHSARPVVSRGRTQMDMGHDSDSDSDSDAPTGIMHRWSIAAAVHR